MNKLQFLYSKSLLGYFVQECLVRYRFKYQLPRITEAVVQGIRLDLSPLSLKARNRLLMGIYEANECRMCREFLTPQDAVAEIGSAIGFIGLFCQKEVGLDRYYSFEANPATLEVLRRNYTLNGLEAHAWNFALAPQDGFVELEVATDFWENTIAGLAPPHASAQTVKVPAGRLATLLRGLPGPVNGLIIDVEGAEQFLHLDEIPQEVNKVIIELHPHLMGSEKTYALIADFFRRGFFVAREEHSTFVFLRSTSRGS